MGSVSLRLPDHLEQRLNEEARLSGQPRSQLMREAMETLLHQRREERAPAQRPRRWPPCGLFLPHPPNAGHHLAAESYG
jgi:predicted transcriptional regulator